jgi:hypothetical protein
MPLSSSKWTATPLSAVHPLTFPSTHVMDKYMKQNSVPFVHDAFRDVLSDHMTFADASDRLPSIKAHAPWEQVQLQKIERVVLLELRAGASR